VNTRGGTRGRNTGSGGKEGVVDLGTERLVRQIMDLGFSEPWARETALRLRILQRRAPGDSNAMSRLVASPEHARTILGLSNRVTLYKWVSRGNLTPLVERVDEGQGWVTDQVFLVADCEYLDVQRRVSSPMGIGPTPWEPPTDDEVRSWLAARGEEWPLEPLKDRPKQ